MAELFAALGLTPGIWVACFATVMLSAGVQRLSGQAFGMIAAPLVALVAPDYLPAGLLLLGIVVGFSSAAVDLSAIAAREIVPGFIGRATGAVIAALIAVQVGTGAALSTLIALVVLLAVALSLGGWRVPIRPATLVGAGVAAGIMGTLTAVGAPPMAMLYQHEAAKRARAMQNAFFAWGMCVSVLALWWQGLVTAGHLLFALSLVPAVAIGLAVSMPIAKRTERRAIRPFALGLSTIAALVLLAKAALA